LSGCDATYSRISLSLKRQWWWGWARPRTGIWVRHIDAPQHIEKDYLDTRCRDRGATYRAPLSVGYSNNLIECYQLSCKLTYMKTKKQIEKINISMKWEELLPMYASIYSSLNETGKLQVQKELKILGAKIDRLNK
jgi:hypothetical protein